MRHVVRAIGGSTLGLLVCIVSTHTEAAATASASLTNLRFTVVDLNLNDGIAAGFSYVFGGNDGVGTVGWMRTYALSTPDAPPIGSDFQYITDETQRYRSVSTSGTIVSTATSGPGFQALNATGTTGPGDASRATFSAVVRAGAASLLVQPNTRLNVTADIALSGAGDFATDNTCVDCANSFARTWFFFGLNRGLLPDSQTQFTFERTMDRTHPSFSDMTQMNISVATGAEAAMGGMFAQAWVGGGVSPVPVPEPQTWALMLAGLAGVGVAARRRPKRP